MGVRVPSLPIVWAKVPELLIVWARVPDHESLSSLQGSSVAMAMQLPRSSRAEHSLVIVVFFVCVGVTMALTILGGWHVYLVSLSETTIEFYTNKRDALRMKKEGQVQ